jgi:hypothetical protein
MKPSQLASQGAGWLGRGLGEIADSLVAGFQLLGLGLYSFWLHLVLGALLLARFALAILRHGPGGTSGRRA